MHQMLKGKKAMILVSNGIDESVMSSIQRSMVKTGAELTVVSTDAGLVNSWNGKTWGLYFPVDSNVSTTLGSDFDMLIVPSGKLAVDKLKANPHCERIINSFAASEKPMFFFGNASEILGSLDYADTTASRPASGGVGSELASSIFSMIAYFSDYSIEQDNYKQAMAA